MKLEEQLSVKAFLILIIFKELYLVNSCLIFDGSFQVSIDSYEENDHLGLISVQNYIFGQTGKFILYPTYHRVSFQVNDSYSLNRQ